MFGIVEKLKSVLFAEDEYGATPPGEEYEGAPAPRHKERVIESSTRALARSSSDDLGIRTRHGSALTVCEADVR